MYLCSNLEVYRKYVFQIEVFLFNIRIILDVDFQYSCIYFETQKYTWSRLSRLMYLLWTLKYTWSRLSILMYLFWNSKVYILEVDFQIYEFMWKLRSVFIFEVDFLNKLLLFKLRSILELYYISERSRSINKVLLKYKQENFLFCSVFIIHLYFFLGSSLKAYFYWAWIWSINEV